MLVSSLKPKLRSLLIFQACEREACGSLRACFAMATRMAAGSAVSSFAAKVSSSSLEGKRSSVFGTNLACTLNVTLKASSSAKTVVTKAQLSPTVSLPGDYGFDPLGLMDPEGAGGFIDPQWLPYAEIINGRFAMLGAAGAIAPEVLGRIGLIPQETAIPWFQSGVIPPVGNYSYWADPYTLFVLEMALMGFAEHRRAQDYYKPGSMGKQYFLGLEKFLGGSGNPAYPGGPIFNFLGFGKNEKELQELKVKEVKNGRLAMMAVLGYFTQAIFTGVGPFQNLLDHLADPVHNNVLTNLKIH
uniref:Chlorophyll a-b binding protein, chloroplastic n=1 Tax=Physcomitrium patens TaxID=3218 RepID=A0A7I4E0E0_PHYPA